MKMKRFFSFTAIVVGCLLSALSVSAALVQRQKVTSTPRGVGAQFGNAVAISGNTMVVGARFDSTTASQAGAAYVFVLVAGTWTQQAVLLANDGALADKFGYAVAISEDTIVIGAYNDDSPLSNAGSAYVFIRSGSTWSQQQKLTPNDTSADDQFGISVAVSGSTAFVGANFSDQPSNSDAGAVYRFTQSGTVWTQAQKLIPVGGVILGDHFGESIAISGTKLAVGSPGADIPFTAAGSVYVFVDAGGGVYIQQDKISIPDGANGDSFGFSVAIDGNTLVGGATQYTPIIAQPAYGAAYVYEFNGSTWTSQGRITASDGASVDRFGYSVAVTGDTVAVGAREDDTPVGPDAGSAYIFTRTGAVWTEKQKMAPADPFNGDRFGVSVAFGPNGTVAVGAAEKALSAPNGQGAVYVFNTIDRTAFDFDGDARADPSVYRPSGGNWYLLNTTTGFTASQFGISSDILVPADYSGDGKTDIAVYRTSIGTWFALRSEDHTLVVTTFGLSGDIPVPGDYDGDTKADVAVYRPSSGVWYLLQSTGGFTAAQFGLSSDVPSLGDYDGDKKNDIAVYRPSTGVWYRLNSSNSTFFAIGFGQAGDKVVPADYTGDGKTDIAVWRPSNGVWYILRSEDLSFYGAAFGLSADIPGPADFDGDGKADISVWRPGPQSVFYVQQSTSGFTVIPWGLNEDRPIPNAYVY